MFENHSAILICTSVTKKCRVTDGNSRSISVDKIKTGFSKYCREP